MKSVKPLLSPDRKNKLIVKPPEWYDGYLDLDRLGNMEQDGGRIHQVYVSNQDIWWNKGNETKPNFEEFNQLGWVQIQQTAGMEMVNELTIRTTVSQWQRYRLFKIVIPSQKQNEPDEIKYYYVSKVLKFIGTKSIEVELEIDLWCSYLVHDEKLAVWSNRLNIDWVQNGFEGVYVPFVNDLPKFRTQGVETDPGPIVLGTTKTKNQEWLIDEFKFRPSTKWTSTFPLSNIYIPYHLITYYVFKVRQTDHFKPTKGHIVLIPVLFEQATRYDDNYDLDFIIQNVDKFYYTSFKTYSFDYQTGQNPKPARFYYLNSFKNLDKLVNAGPLKNEAGLGDFLGIYVGPICFNFQSTFKQDFIAKSGPISNFLPAEYFVYWGHSQQNGAKELNIFGFFAIRLENCARNYKVPGEWKWSDTFKEAIIRNKRPFADDRGWFSLFADSVAFADGFNFLSKKGEFFSKSEITSFNDTYFEWLRQSKVSREAQLNAIKQNNILSAGNIAAGVATGGAGGILSGVTTLIQMSNTMKQFQAQEQQAKLNSNFEIKYGDQYFQNPFWQVQTTHNQPITTYEFNLNIFEDNKKKGVILWGDEYFTEPSLLNYYGVKTDFYLVGGSLKQKTKGYFIFNELVEIKLNQNQFSPQIRQLLIQMLKNGIRIATKEEVRRGFN